MAARPHLHWRSFGPPPPRWKTDRLQKVLDRGLEYFYEENRGAFLELEPYLSAEEGNPGVELVLQLVAGALIYGASQALELNVISAMIQREPGVTEAEWQAATEEMLEGLERMANEIGQVEAKLRARKERSPE